MCFSTTTPTRLSHSDASGKSPSVEKMVAKPSLRQPLSVKNIPDFHGINKSKKPSSFRHGRWTKDERLSFLMGLRRYGRGNWKKIASLIPTRGTIQTKTHAQVIMKKLDAGDNIFEELDSFERRFISEQDENKLELAGTDRNTEMTTPTFVWKTEDFESAKILVTLKSDPTTYLV